MTPAWRRALFAAAALSLAAAVSILSLSDSARRRLVYPVGEDLFDSGGTGKRYFPDRLFPLDG